jgi:hypothetical protein
MTTEMYEAYSIEEGDTVFLNSQTFYVQIIEPHDANSSVFWLVDDEGFQKSTVIEDTKKLPVVIDTLAEV